MYFLLGISVAFAFLLVVNLLAALSASAVWKVVSGSVGNLSARSQAAIIFGLRIMPVAASLVFVLAFVVPSYLIYEPEASGEVVSMKLLLIVAASSLGVAIAAFRVFRTWLATGRLVSSWLDAGERMEIPGVDVPIFRIEHPFPVIAVVGVFRPRIFLAAQVLNSLSAEEFNAAIAHEYGHLTAYDNLKHTILSVCRDLLILPIGRGLDRAWTENVEAVADEYAANKGRSTALDLASALVKIARIVPANGSPAMPSGAFLLEERNVDVTSRVRRLIRLSEGYNPIVRSGFLGFSLPSWLLAVALIGFVMLPLINDRSLVKTHEAVERFVHLLQ